MSSFDPMTEKLKLAKVITTNNKCQDFLELLLLAISEKLCLFHRAMSKDLQSLFKKIIGNKHGKDLPSFFFESLMQVY